MYDESTGTSGLDEAICRLFQLDTADHSHLTKLLADALAYDFENETAVLKIPHSVCRYHQKTHEGKQSVNFCDCA